MQKRLNRSRCRLEGADSVGSRNHELDRGSRSPREWEVLGLSGPLKSIGSLCCSVRSRRDHLAVNNGMTALMLQPTAVLLTCQCPITLSP